MPGALLKLPTLELAVVLMRRLTTPRLPPLGVGLPRLRPPTKSLPQTIRLPPMIRLPSAFVVASETLSLCPSVLLLHERFYLDTSNVSLYLDSRLSSIPLLPRTFDALLWDPVWIFWILRSTTFFLPLGFVLFIILRLDSFTDMDCCSPFLVLFYDYSLFVYNPVAHRTIQTTCPAHCSTFASPRAISAFLLGTLNLLM